MHCIKSVTVFETVSSWKHAYGIIKPKHYDAEGI